MIENNYTQSIIDQVLPSHLATHTQTTKRIGIFFAILKFTHTCNITTYKYKLHTKANKEGKTKNKKQKNRQSGNLASYLKKVISKSSPLINKFVQVVVVQSYFCSPMCSET